MRMSETEHEARELVVDLVQALCQLLGATGPNGGPEQMAFARSRVNRTFDEVYRAMNRWMEQDVINDHGGDR
jgi:hypothetical protein